MEGDRNGFCVYGALLFLQFPPKIQQSTRRLEKLQFHRAALRFSLRRPGATWMCAAPLLWCTDFRLYGDCTCVLLKEQDVNTSGASLSCKRRVDLRHQLSSRLWKEALLQRDTLYLDCLGDSERDAVFKLEKWTEISVLQHIVKSTSLHRKKVHLEVSTEVIVVKEDSVQGNWPGRPLNRI